MQDNIQDSWNLIALLSLVLVLGIAWLLSDLVNRLFRKPAEEVVEEEGPEPEEENSQKIAWVATEINCNDKIPKDYTLCVFDKEQLVTTCRDRAPDSKTADEAWWLIPTDEFPVTLMVDIDQDMVEVDVMVRLDAEPELLELLTGRKLLWREDLVPRLEKELRSLVEKLEQEDIQRLIDLGKPQQERLRARLSLRLQKIGLRCTQIVRFEPRSQ